MPVLVEAQTRIAEMEQQRDMALQAAERSAIWPPSTVKVSAAAACKDVGWYGRYICGMYSYLAACYAC